MSGAPELNWAGGIIKPGEGYGGRMYEEEEAERERNREECSRKTWTSSGQPLTSC